MGVGKLRTLDGTNLCKINKMMVIQDNDAPLPAADRSRVDAQSISEGLSTEDLFARMERDAPWKPGFERMKARLDQGYSMMEAVAAVREDPAVQRELEQRMESLSRRPEPK